MVRLREGDDQALNELMERWHKPLHSFILRYVGNYADSIELAEAARSQIAELIREEVAKLPHDLKTVVLLFEYENLSYDEIGGILGCTPKAVEMRLYRARKLLTKKLAGIF
jgi:DNA-directed RNA polymerase specialized sigma24 family protein